MTTPITVEVGTTRPLQLVGRDMAAAAHAARSQGTTTDVLKDGVVIAAVIPAGRGVLTERELGQHVTALLAQLRSTAFKPDAEVSDAKVLGLLVAKFLEFGPSDVLAAAASALEEANCHTEAAQVRAMDGAS